MFYDRNQRESWWKTLSGYFQLRIYIVKESVTHLPEEKERG
jgi:hypothetical protein